MGNKSSRVKSQKTSKGKNKTALRTKSLNNLPQVETSPSLPRPISQSVRQRKYVVSEQPPDPQQRNSTRHCRQNTAPEIVLQSTPKSLKLSDFSKVVHQPELDSDVDETEVDIPIESALEPPAEELCHICSVYTGKIKFLCRVCYQVYHLGCLQKIEQHQPSPVACFINRADSELGWSCHQCDNISRLLSETEMATLIYTLEQCNIKQDSSIFRQQYLCYKEADYREKKREKINAERLTDERSIFDKLDIKHTGVISWAHFINSEAVKILNKRSKNQLVKLLTKAELYRCRQKFMEFDHDKDGEITRFESLKAQMSSYGDLSCFPTPTPSKLLYTNEEIGGVINWMEFLQDQVLCIIAMRRNSFCKEPPKNVAEKPFTASVNASENIQTNETKTDIFHGTKTVVEKPIEVSVDTSENIKVKMAKTEELHATESVGVLSTSMQSDTQILPQIIPTANVSNDQNPSNKTSAIERDVEPTDMCISPIKETSETKVNIQKTKDSGANGSDAAEAVSFRKLPTSDSSIPQEDSTVLLRHGRSKSTVFQTHGNRSLKLQKPIKRITVSKSADQSFVEDPFLTEPNLKKLPNVNLTEDKKPPIITPKPNLFNPDEGESDVVRRYPNMPRKQTMSLYVFESNRRVHNEFGSIRRPMSVVGFKMEPTQLVSKMSIKLKRPISTPQTIKPLTRKEDNSNDSQSRTQIHSRKRSTNLQDVNKENKITANQYVGNNQKLTRESLKQKADLLHHPASENTGRSSVTADRPDVEIRGKEDNDKIPDIKPKEKFRVSDSEILKSERVSKTKRAQTISLFVTRSERAVLTEQRDIRPLSLG